MGDAQTLRNRFTHIVGAHQHLIIPEAQQLEALSAQEGLAHCIGGRIQVLATVKLDDQRAVQASEIGDIRPNGTLPAKLASQQAPITQVAPKQALGSGHLAPQRFCESDFFASAHWTL
ncbi:hypothetical protein GGR62_001713 [Xanthomonas campestris]|nr:hypothetical protein [Xanthomonas sp. 3075]